MFSDFRHFGDVLRKNAEDRAATGGLVFGETRLSWPEVNARANRFASALRKRGLRQGDRVAILSKNSHRYVETLFALAKVGAVSVPINYRLSAPEVDFICKDAQASYLLVGDGYEGIADDVATAKRSIRDVFRLESESKGSFQSYEALVSEGSEADPVPEREIAPEDLLLFLYTSGTTGFPKGVMYTHYRTIVGMLIHVLAIGSHPTHRVMLPAPLYSAAGIAGIFCAGYVGSHIVIVNFDAEHVLRTVEQERITFTNFVPTTIQMLASRDDVARYDVSSLKLLLYGGSPMPEPVLRQASRVFDCDFRQTYATSETGCAGTVLEPTDHRMALAERPELLKSCGRPQVNVEVRVVDENGAPVSPGDVGEIAVRTIGNMIGYWNNEKATAKALRDGWVYAGDLATVDEQGYIYLVDRKNDMIVSGALNVYPTEVERAIHLHPAVKDCAVIGVPHDTWGEAVHAVVALESGASLTLDELRGFLATALADYKQPKGLGVVETIPRNPTGKALRRRLREPYWEGRERQI